MSKKHPVMSHDPLAGLVGSANGAAADSSATLPDSQDQKVVADDTEAMTGDSAVVTLESALTIAEAAELHEILLKHMRAMTPLVICASDVETVDTAGLQLIAATFKSASEKGVAVRIDAPSECFMGAVRQIGLDALLGLGNEDRAA